MCVFIHVFTYKECVSVFIYIYIYVYALIYMHMFLCVRERVFIIASHLYITKSIIISIKQQKQHILGRFLLEQYNERTLNFENLFIFYQTCI